MAPETADAPKPNRRWLQFSLRSLLIFTLICAVASAWLVRKRDQKRKERDAVAALIKLGGTVWYDYQAGNPKATPPGPGWLRAILGENFFGEVRFVAFPINGSGLYA